MSNIIESINNLVAIIVAIFAAFGAICTTVVCQIRKNDKLNELNETTEKMVPQLAKLCELAPRVQKLEDDMEAMGSTLEAQATGMDARFVKLENTFLQGVANISSDIKETGKQTASAINILKRGMSSYMRASTHGDKDKMEAALQIIEDNSRII